MRNTNHSQYLLGDTTPSETFGRISRRIAAPGRVAGAVVVSANEADIQTDPRHPAPGLRSIELHAAARQQRSSAIGDSIVAATRALVTSVERAFAELRRRRDERATYRVLAGLDARTLRDIGLSRDEIRSVAHRLAYGDATLHLLSAHRGA